MTYQFYPKVDRKFVNFRPHIALHLIASKVADNFTKSFIHQAHNTSIISFTSAFNGYGQFSHFLCDENQERFIQIWSAFFIELTDLKGVCICRFCQQNDPDSKVMSTVTLTRDQYADRISHLQALVLFYPSYFFLVNLQ